VLLLLEIRLGLEDVNPIYYEMIKVRYHLPRAPSPLRPSSSLSCPPRPPSPVFPFPVFFAPSRHYNATLTFLAAAIHLPSVRRYRRRASLLIILLCRRLHDTAPWPRLKMCSETVCLLFWVSLRTSRNLAPAFFLSCAHVTAISYKRLPIHLKIFF
jgi:hypothetical protein